MRSIRSNPLGVWLLAAILLLAGNAAAQQKTSALTNVSWAPVTGSGAPTSTSCGGTCSSAFYGLPYTDLTNKNQYVYTGTGLVAGWMQVGGGLPGSGFSAGNAVPFFTTVVTNPNTTPNLAFALISQPSNSVLSGPTIPTGANAARIQSAITNTFTGSGTNIATLTLPAVVAGDSIVVLSACTLSSYTVTDAQSDTFISDGEQSGLGQTIHYGHIASAVGGNTTLTYTAAGNCVDEDGPGFVTAIEYSPLGAFDVAGSYVLLGQTSAPGGTMVVSSSITTTTANDLILDVGAYYGNSLTAGPSLLAITSPSFSTFATSEPRPHWFWGVVADAGGGAIGSKSATTVCSPSYYARCGNFQIAYTVPTPASTTAVPTFKLLSSLFSTAYDPLGTAAALTATPQTISALWNFGTGNLNVNGVLPCMQDGTNCPTSGATPGGTAGAMQYYLTSTTLGGLNGTGFPFLNGAVAPTIATTPQITATINGTGCTLGTSCAPVGSSATPVLGDVTGTVGASTVVKVNGGAVPVSASGIATNSSGQTIAQTSGNIDTILGYVPVGAPVFSGNLASNVLADYTFQTGIGTTVYDVSGANACSGSPCNGTFGGGSSTSPSWYGTTGLLFGGLTNFSSNTNGVSLPATLNTVKTMVIAFYQNPISAVASPGLQIQPSGYDNLLSSSMGANGLTIMGGGFCLGGYAQPCIWSNTTVGGDTSSQNFGSGFHIETFVLGSNSGDLDHIYIDGVEAPYVSRSYVGQGYHYGLVTSGNLFLGNANVGAGAGGGNNIFYRVRMYSAELSASDVAQITRIFRQDVQNRGVSTTPTPANIALPILHCIGDSQTSTGTVATPYCSGLSLTNQPAYTIYNWGISGITLQGMTGSDPWRVGPLCSTNFGTPSIANVMAGVNDINPAAYSGTTPAQVAATVFQNLAGEVQTLKRAGCVVFVSTKLSEYGTDIAGNSYDADGAAYNALIRQQAVAVGATGITDWDNPLIQATGASPSAGNTYFQSGGLHLTQAGETLQSTMMSAVLNYWSGTTAGNPSLPTGTHSVLWGEAKFLSTNSITGATTLTLPECQGPTGAVLTWTNPQSTYVVTVKNLSSLETINGIDYSSTGYTLPSNSTQTFTDVALPQAVSGCVWSATVAPSSVTAPHIIASGTAATLSGTGGTPTCAVGTCLDMRGRLSVPSATTAAVVTFGAAYGAAPVCTVTQNGGATFFIPSWTSTTTALTITTGITLTTGEEFDYACIQ